MKTPDRCRSGTPPSAENGLRGLYFGVWCYRRPTIGASPATFHTVSLGTSVNRGVGHSLALDTGSSSRIMRFTLHWPYLDSTIKLSSDTRRGKWVGKEAVLWPGAWK